MRGWSKRATAAVVVAVVVLVGAPGLAGAHDYRSQQKAKQLPNVGPPVPATAGAVLPPTALTPTATAPTAAVDFAGVVTNLPSDPLVSYRTPADPCDPGSCIEKVVDVAAGSGAMYARVAWQQPSYYVHLWGIAPDDTVVGQESVADDFDKTIGNERTIPVSEFTVANPAPGRWRVQIRAVFGFEIAVDGRVVVTTGPPVEHVRKSVLDLADQFGTQALRVNLVFLGGTPSAQQLEAVKARMPDRYRSAVLLKEGIDCPDPTVDPKQFADCQAGGFVNWKQGYYRGTDTTADDTADGAGGNVPYFEPVKFTYDYKYFEADETYTRDLFGYIKSITQTDKPFDDSANSQFLLSYNAAGGQLRNLDGAGVSPANAQVSDKIDAIDVEHWVFDHRMDGKYAQSFKDLDSGTRRNGGFVNPDPSAYYDPFYTASGTKDLTRMPQGPRTSVTMYVIDSYTTPLAREYFRADRYHSYDVSQDMIDPDVGIEAGPDYLRLWGGNYPFFYLDVGAMPNSYENIDGFTGRVADSSTYPYGDPPVWEAVHNPLWGQPYNAFIEADEGRSALDVPSFALWDKVARDFRMALFLRFTAPYLYRPLPADVFFLAANIWSDYYSRPLPPFSDGGGGISHTVLEKIYKPDYVEKNLGSALPGATFTTERSDPNLQTFRYLGCSNEIAGTNPQPPGTGAVLIPNPACTNSDPAQHALEESKAQGDDLVGAGVPLGAVSASQMRNYIERNRSTYAPLRPGQLTITNISVVFPDVRTWYLPLIVGGVAFGTPNDEIWGILQNVNDRVKPAQATDCAKSLPVAPGCNGVPPLSATADGFSYVIQHEASHFLGLLHPHDTLVLEQDAQGSWSRYGQVYVSLFDFSQAPTTYAGNFFPYSVLDQDIIQRGHWGEYLRQSQDTLADAYLIDGMNGLAGPSEETLAKQAEMERWRELGARLFACGDYLHAEHAGRNAVLAAQGIVGPIVPPRPLQAGEQVLFDISPQAVYGPDGPVEGCQTAVAGRELSPVTGGVSPARQTLPATGGHVAEPLICIALIAFLVSRRAVRRSRIA